MTAVEVPQHLQSALAVYPRCDRQTQRAPGVVERCALASEWAVRCNECQSTAFLCEKHGAAIARVEMVKQCPVCLTKGIVPLRWTFIRLRFGS